MFRRGGERDAVDERKVDRDSLGPTENQGTQDSSGRVRLSRRALHCPLRNDPSGGGKRDTVDRRVGWRLAGTLSLPGNVGEFEVWYAGARPS